MSATVAVRAPVRRLTMNTAPALAWKSIDDVGVVAIGIERQVRVLGRVEQRSLLAEVAGVCDVPRAPKPETTQ